ncbi:MAG: T9SS C-terminal target domain-containing protein, partial [Balneolaceae bacterium]
ELPVQLALRQNYPNPFNPSTRITFELNNPQHVTLSVYDIQGQHITTLLNGERAAGEHHVTFDSGDLASGMYLYRLETPQRTITRAMTLIK